MSLKYEPTSVPLHISANYPHSGLPRHFWETGLLPYPEDPPYVSTALPAVWCPLRRLLPKMIGFCQTNQSQKSSTCAEPTSRKNRRLLPNQPVAKIVDFGLLPRRPHPFAFFLAPFFWRVCLFFGANRCRARRERLQSYSRHFYEKGLAPTPEPGRDCIICAEFARQLLRSNVKRFREGIEFKYHLTLGARVIQKKRRQRRCETRSTVRCRGAFI